jgi:hypothetical protein
MRMIIIITMTIIVMIIMASLPVLTSAPSIIGI